MAVCLKICLDFYPEQRLNFCLSTHATENPDTLIRLPFDIETKCSVELAAQEPELLISINF